MRARTAILLIVTIAAANHILACAPAPHAGERIDIVEESAVIEWNPSTKTETFTRRATFQGKAKDFGFLVPTPTAPALEEVSDSIFSTLEAKTARRTIEKETTKVAWTPLLLYFFSMRTREGMMTAGAPVNVLSTQKIAGYEIAALDASDARVLNEWLAKNGYATTPDLVEWLDAYIKQHWKITAFKIDKSQDEAARTSAVKMTFYTERPFFPYREPASQRENDSYDTVRSLRIFFIGPERVAGTIGANTFWPGVTTWSDTHLTAFVDTSRIRPGTDDLFFSRAAVQSDYELPPFVHENVKKIPIPLDVVVGVMAIVAFVLIRRSRG